MIKWQEFNLLILIKIYWLIINKIKIKNNKKMTQVREISHEKIVGHLQLVKIHLKIYIYNKITKASKKQIVKKILLLLKISNKFSQ